MYICKIIEKLNILIMNKLIYSFIFLSFVAVFSQKKIQFSKVINIAAKQRMLSQRMIKDKVFIQNNVKNEESKIELKNSILQFELGIDILRDFAQNETIKYKVDVLALTFKNFKRLLNNKNKKSLNELIEYNTLFLKICDDVFQAFIQEGTPKGKEQLFENINRVIHISGSIRYLTQRLTMYHAISYFEIKTIYPDEFYNIIIQIEKALNILTISEFNTLEIDDSLSKSLYYWNNLKLELHKKGKTPAGMSKIKPGKLFELANIVLDKVDPIVGKYTEYADTLK